MAHPHGLGPTQANVFWYGLRPWIECGFKQTKRAGWGWHQTRMTDPERTTRHWVAIAVATLWGVSVGGEAEANLPPSSFAASPWLTLPALWPLLPLAGDRFLASAVAFSSFSPLCLHSDRSPWDAFFPWPGRRLTALLSLLSTILEYLPLKGGWEGVADRYTKKRAS